MVTLNSTLNTQQAAAAIGVSAITLKRWLLNGKVADVSRDRNGWRVFNNQDVERIRTYAEGDATPSARASKSNKKFTVASFFSGIGGFDLGFEEHGFQIHYQCEINKFCQHILKKHWKGITLDTNITEVTNDRIPNSDVWIGGFPCQDVSLASMGTRKGLKGARTGLFYEFTRLLGEARPGVIVLENVPGLLSSHQGKDFEIVIKTLAELGYSVGWRTLNSQYFGVPQSRQRVYIVGCYRDREGPARILFEPERSEGHIKKNGPNGEKPVSPLKRVLRNLGGESPVVQSIAYCLYACSARHTGTDWSRTYVSYPSKGAVRRLTAKECEGIMAFPKDWTVPTSNEFGADVESLRYHALGNAVTPPVAAWIGARVRAYLADKSARASVTSNTESLSLAAGG